MNNKKIFREFISLDEASSRLKDYLSPIQKKFEIIPISEALGSAIFKDITSKFDVPPFDKALMDGYAVRAEDTFDAEEYCPVTLKLIGSSEMGKEPEFNVKKSTTVEISTGAPIPKGANSVIMLEYTKRKNGVI